MAYGRGFTSKLRNATQERRRWSAPTCACSGWTLTSAGCGSCFCDEFRLMCIQTVWRSQRVALCTAAVRKKKQRFTGSTGRYMGARTAAVLRAQAEQSASTAAGVSRVEHRHSWPSVARVKLHGRRRRRGLHKAIRRRLRHMLRACALFQHTALCVRPTAARRRMSCMWRSSATRSSWCSFGPPWTACD